MISVIIAAYNAGETLRACLDSVVNQNFQDKEVIVTDDGSTDSTPEILKSYGDRIISIRIPHSGLSAARNAGIDAAKGEYLTFVDADDRLLPDALASLHSTITVIGADICIGNQKTAVILSPEKALKRTLYRTLDGSAWGKLYRRSLFESERFTPGLCYEDLDLLFRLYPLCGKVALCDRYVYDYRINPEGISRSFTERRFDLLKVTETIERQSSSDPALLKAARNRRLAACLHIIHLLKTCDREGRYAHVYDLCKKEVKRLRGEALRDMRSRMKVKAGAALSYFGIWL